ncbi:hypothetical protein [Dolichospermum compactum]|nr:hypothetical protein [Dolichospermum compactum]
MGKLKSNSKWKSEDREQMINAVCGVIEKILNTPSRKTGNDHHTWWFPVNQEPWRNFEIVNIAYPD